MQTLNENIKLIQTLKEAHGQLKSGTFYFGDEWEFMKTEQASYPYFGLRLLGSSIDGKIHTRNFNMFFCDRVNKGELNETEVLSDMEIIAWDIYNQLKYNLENNNPEDTSPATVTLSSALTPFTQGFLDGCAGVEMNIGIIQFYDRQTCNIPT